MNKQEENINTQTEQKEKQDHYQKYRGNSLLVLEQLEHSAGLTTRQISDAILGNARVIAVTIQRLVNRCVIEKVENWGWRINRNGIKILEIFNKTFTTTTTKNVNISTTQQQHKVNMKNDTTTETINDNIPSCFEKAYCHIRRFMKNPIFNYKTAKQCDGCVQFNTNDYRKNISSWQAVKIST
jgi:benzoyl-CoA reductase/2-hydroxyglutaryl-CoA dehydratase subunit BcrC/BadD/HgdB